MLRVVSATQVNRLRYIFRPDYFGIRKSGGVVSDENSFTKVRLPGRNSPVDEFAFAILTWYVHAHDKNVQIVINMLVFVHKHEEHLDSDQKHKHYSICVLHC